MKDGDTDHVDRVGDAEEAVGKPSHPGPAGLHSSVPSRLCLSLARGGGQGGCSSRTTTRAPAQEARVPCPHGQQSPDALARPGVQPPDHAVAPSSKTVDSTGRGEDLAQALREGCGSRKKPTRLPGGGSPFGDGADLAVTESVCRVVTSKPFPDRNCCPGMRPFPDTHYPRGQREHGLQEVLVRPCGDADGLGNSVSSWTLWSALLVRVARQESPTRAG